MIVVKSGGGTRVKSFFVQGKEAVASVVSPSIGVVRQFQFDGHFHVDRGLGRCSRKKECDEESFAAHSSSFAVVVSQ